MLSRFSKYMSTFVWTVAVSAVFFIPGMEPVKAQAPQFSVSVAADKASVKSGEDFQVTVLVTNGGSAAIKNLEIRVPFLRTVADSTLVSESPSFNKLLDSGDFPAGFNSRSWLINTFDAGETKQFVAKYTVDSDPKTPNGLSSVFTLPATWNDPKNLPSSSVTSIQKFRADIYLNDVYYSSFESPLPQLAALDNQVALVPLNAKYTFAGSKTTNLKAITNADLKSVPNFTLETSDVLVEWTVPVDLSTTDVPAKLTKLDDFFKPVWGKLTVSQDQLAFLNKPIKVTFKNIDLVNEPKIRINTDTVTLNQGKAVWAKTAKTVVVALPALTSVSLLPNIETEKSVLETETSATSIKGKISDSSSSIFYNIDNTGKKEIVGIDLQTGAFEISLTDAESIKQVELTTTFKKNDESTSKIVVVKYKASDTTPTQSSQAATTKEPENTSIVFNPITIVLLLSALAVLAIIGGYIYFLYNRRKKDKKKSENVLTPFIESVTTVGSSKPDVTISDLTRGTTEPLEDLQEIKIDLNKLKNEYALHPESVKTADPVDDGDTGAVESSHLKKD
jgi:hypothetical protein